MKKTRAVPCAGRSAFEALLRGLVLVLALLAGAGTPASAQQTSGAAAKTFPNKPIRLVIPFAAGSATDSAGRILAEELSQRLGQNVIVDNRPGAFGQIAADAVARSSPDGYTLILATNTTHSANPHLYKTLPYDPIKDFEPVARVCMLPFVLVVNPELPVKTTAELIGYARAHPGKLSYGTSNSMSLVAAETIDTLAKVSMIGVTYKSSPQAIMDLVAGRIQVMVSDFATAMPQVRAGRLRVVAVTTAKRSALVPDAPPIGETLRGFDLAGWSGLLAPAGTPKDIVAKLAQVTLDTLARADVRAKLAAVGLEADPLGSEAFGRYLREQIAHWGRLIREAGIQPE